jgi:two-component system, chemotaxis family, CheB/CheR fusion protein
MTNRKEPAGKKDGPKPGQPGAGEVQTAAPSLEAGLGPEDTIRFLKKELEAARSELRISREEHEAAGARLHAANAQLRAVNEEYRGAAVRIEARAKELQGIDTELRGLNAELKARLDAASHANAELQNLMEAAGTGALFLDSSLRIERFTPKIAELLGIGPRDTGKPVTDLAERLNCPSLAADAQAVLGGRKIVECEIAGNGGRYLTRLLPLRTMNGGGQGVVCTFVDISAHAAAADTVKASEARLRLLLSELSHRVKNTLAVVQSMARQSFRGDVSREAGLEIFSNRLRALAEAHNAVAGGDWRGADLRELAARQLNAYAKPGGKTAILSGPAVSIPPGIATPLALVLHELATNALKYGALSSPAGSLRLEWGYIQRTAGRALQLTWRESGGPRVKPPPKEGFGSWLIQHGLPDAEVVLDYPPDGAVCTIVLPEESLKREGQGT